MFAARIIKDEPTVDARLAELFGVTRDELVKVVREIVGARADAVENDPVGTAGQFAYIHGTRNIRGLFGRKGWHNLRKDNIELTEHPELPLMVGYKNVDLAASDAHIPQAISGKGAGAERAIDEAQGSLFSMLEDEESPALSAATSTGLWHFCVSVVGDDVRAELSLAAGVEGGNFKGFLERIFIVNKGDWDSLKPHVVDLVDAVDFEPVVVRK